MIKSGHQSCSQGGLVAASSGDTLPASRHEVPRRQAITSGSELDRHKVANCHCRNEVFSNVFAFPCVRGQLSADDAEHDYIHVSDLVAAHSDALAYLRDGGASTTLNCVYGRGFSVLDVIETVKRMSGVDFKLEFAARRAGDPAQLVAACDRVRWTLKWQPRFDDLQIIVAHALKWERKLQSLTADCSTRVSSLD
jgi:hypothetical protein